MRLQDFRRFLGLIIVTIVALSFIAVFTVLTLANHSVEPAGAFIGWFGQKLVTYEVLCGISLVAFLISLYCFVGTEGSWRARIGAWSLQVLLIPYLIGGFGACIEHFIPPIHETVRVAEKEWKHTRGKTGDTPESDFIVYLSSKNWYNYTDRSGDIYDRVNRGDTLEVTARPWSKDWTKVSIQRTGEVLEVGTTTGQFAFRIVLWLAGLVIVGGPVFWLAVFRVSSWRKS